MTREEQLRKRIQLWSSRLEELRKERDVQRARIGDQKRADAAVWEKEETWLEKFQDYAQDVIRRMEQKKRENDLEDTLDYAEFMLREAENAIDEAVEAIAQAEEMKRESNKQ